MLIHEIQKLPDWFIELALVAISACAGHLINLISSRLPLAILADSDPVAVTNPSLSTPQVKKIHWRDHFPVLNYFLPLSKKVVKSDKKVASYYLLLELVTILITLILYQVMGMHYETLWVIVLSWWLIALAVIDFNHYLLPDQLTLSLLWLGLLVNLHNLFVPLQYAVCSAVFAYILMWAIDGLYYLLRRRNGLGQGDWKLLAAFAAWFGFIPTLYILALSAILGSIWGIVGIVSKKLKLNSPLAFGSFLCIAAGVYVLSQPYLPQLTFFH